jgi:hypothetical protein
MAASVIFQDLVEVPLGIDGLDAFRRWLTSDSFPQHGRIDFLAGHIEVDTRPGSQSSGSWTDGARI